MIASPLLPPQSDRKRAARALGDRVTDVIDGLGQKLRSEAIAESCARLSQVLEDAYARKDNDLDALLNRMIAGIDRRVGAMLDAILCDPDFAALEASWRGLWHVVDNIPADANVRIAVWSRSKDWIREDLSGSDVTQSKFFETVYTLEYGQFGGEPYACILANFDLEPSLPDIALATRMVSVAAMAHAPILAAPSPRFFGMTSLRELQHSRDLSAVFHARAFDAWKAFRSAEDSRYLGLILPKMLLRAPYRLSELEADSAPLGTDGTAEGFVYDSRADGPDQPLWGSPVFAFAVRVADSFVRYGTTLGLLGTSDDSPAALDAHPSLGPDYYKPPVEVLLSQRLQRELVTLGFIPLTSDPRNKPSMRFTTAVSVQAPKRFGVHEGGSEATVNYLLGTRLSHLMLVCRFCHYLKVTQRESIGGTRTREEVEEELNAWIRQYARDAERLTPTERRKFPLRRARVEATSIEGVADWYRLGVHVQPHFRYLDQEFVLSAIGRLAV